MMAPIATLLIAGTALIALVALRLFRRRRSVPPAAGPSPVVRQHLHLYQGGRLDERALEAAKAELRDLLAADDLAGVEACLQPGPEFVLRVRALAELGGDDVAEILERQLARPFTSDPLERAWYALDLAQALRQLDRPQAICAHAPDAADSPLGHLVAAEAVNCPGFTPLLRRPATAVGSGALRLLHLALEGLRLGVPAQLFAEARLGLAVLVAWENRPRLVEPLLVRVLHEALRQWRRAEHSERALPEPLRGLFHQQMALIGRRAERWQTYLRQAAAPLRTLLRCAADAEQRDALLALDDLRAETAPVLLPLLGERRFAHRAAAVEVLRWSLDPRVGPRLRELARSRRGVGVPLAAILRALRHHPSADTERFLLRHARHADAACRAAAVGGLGWWGPVRQSAVRRCLAAARLDASAAVRNAALAALARLGERRALAAFREALTAESTTPVHDAIGRVAAEGLTWLWPDLDRLADAEDADIALHAREALESLRENLTFAACG